MTEPEFTTEELENEEWRPAPDFPDYEISSIGRARRATPAPVMATRYPAGYLIKPSVARHGYLVVGLMRNGKQVRRSLHRLVALAFLGQPRPEQEHVNHKDACVTNNRVENLEWCTVQENIDHSNLVLNHFSRGEHRYNAVLTEHLVLQIHEMRMKGYNAIQIGQALGVTQCAVQNVVSRTSWHHVTKDLPSNYPPPFYNRASGSRNGNARLNEEDIRAIRHKLQAGASLKSLAVEYSTSGTTIARIRDRKVWSHVA